jgi:HK97 family phage major capsid protein
MNELEKLRARLNELHEISKGIQAKADADKRDLTVDETKELDAVMAEFDQVETDIKRRERIIAQEARLAVPQQTRRITAPVAGTVPPSLETSEASAAASDNGLRNTRLRTVEERQRWGFTNFGEFARAVHIAVMRPSSMDQRLIQNAAASTFGSEGVSADGGFAVPPEWRSQIMAQVESEDGFLNRTDVQTITSNSITYPTEEKPAWASSGGIRAYWDGEAATMTQSKPELKDLTVKTHRLTALVPVTDELLQDAPAMNSYVPAKAGEVFAFRLNDAIVNGTGAGQPLGIMNAPCTVQVSKESSQTSGTVHADNVVKMMARMPAASFRRAVWLINQDVVPFVMKLGFAVTTASGTAAGAGALWMAPQGLANQSEYGSILGRPILVTEACATVGTTGDIILADLSKYLSVVTGALRTDVSIHLWFDQSLIARKSGSNTLSHFIRLETR